MKRGELYRSIRIGATHVYRHSPVILALYHGQLSVLYIGQYAQLAGP